MTVKGAIEEPYKTAFDAKVTKVGKEESGATYVVLDESWFYPEGGGQPADRGSVAGAMVIDVQLVEGEIRHVLGNGAEVTEGDTVPCAIDWERRFDYMQQHHAQHLLSAVLADRFDAPTVSVHLGSEACAIEVTRDDLTEEEVCLAVDQVNALIRENRRITSTVVSLEQALGYPLRKTPAVTGDVRLVIVEGVDYNPCGGTHPERTGEVQLVHLTGMERARGGLRVTYLAGTRVAARMRQFQRITDEASRLLNSPTAGILETLRDQLDAHHRLEKELRSLKENLLEQSFADWLMSAADKEEPVVTFLQAGLGMKALQKLAAKAVQELPEKLHLFATFSEEDSGEPHLQFVLTAGGDCEVDLKAYEKEIFSFIGGKGGGNRKKLQGGGRTPISLEAFAHRVAEILR